MVKVLNWDKAIKERENGKMENLSDGYEFLFIYSHGLLIRKIIRICVVSKLL